MRILIVEDELKLSEPLAKTLEKNKYLVDTASDGITGLDYALSDIYDVILLDIMLPGMNGLDVLRQIRAGKIKTPVLLLTARDEISDRVTGLDTGADDYLTKPFSTDELLARIRALSRRSPDVAVDNSLSFGDLTLNVQALELSCNGRSIKLGLKEAQIMELLIRYGVHTLRKEDLLVKVWGYESDAEYNNVEVYISFLRKKLTHLKSGVSIKTLRGVGYTLGE